MLNNNHAVVLQNDQGQTKRHPAIQEFITTVNESTSKRVNEFTTVNSQTIVKHVSIHDLNGSGNGELLTINTQ